MVCIAAFIILALVGVFVAFLSIFNRNLGRKYWAVFKKAWGCVGKKVRLQKCDTNFKDDVKNTLLSRVILKHPKWVGPLGTAIEVSAVLIVILTVWSLIEAVKAILALWVFGTCNVSQPAQCALGAEVCSIDSVEPSNPAEYVGRWFSEWGEIFGAIPDRFQNWQAEDYVVEPAVTALGDASSDAEQALDIFDPGCLVCLQSYRNQKSSGFFDQYKTTLMVFPISLPDGGYKYANADLFARYFYASAIVSQDDEKLTEKNLGANLVDRLFTGANAEGINYQSVLTTASADEAKNLLEAWLKDFGANKKQVARITELVVSDQVTEILNQVSEIVENKIHAKGIPTLIYDGKKHNGLYKAD